MTYVIEHLEGHNTVISPETVEVLAKNLLFGSNSEPSPSTPSTTSTAGKHLKYSHS